MVIACNDAGAHTPPEGRGVYSPGAGRAYLRALREYPVILTAPTRVPFCYGQDDAASPWSLLCNDTGSHTPLGDRQARLTGVECACFRRRRIPCHLDGFVRSRVMQFLRGARNLLLPTMRRKRPFGKHTPPLYKLLLNFEVRQRLAELILLRKTGVEQIAAFILPLGKSAIVEHFMTLIYDKRHNIVLQALFEHNETPDSAIASWNG